MQDGDNFRVLTDAEMRSAVFDGDGIFDATIPIRGRHAAAFEAMQADMVKERRAETRRKIIVTFAAIAMGASAGWALASWMNGLV